MIHTLRLPNLFQMPLSKKEMSHKSEVSIFLISLKSKLKETSSEIMLKVRRDWSWPGDCQKFAYSYAFSKITNAFC